MNALDPRVDRWLRREEFYDDEMIRAYLDVLREYPEVLARLRSITRPDEPVGDDGEALRRYAEVEDLACGKAVRRVLRDRVARSSRRYLRLMIGLGLGWVAIGAGVRFGLPPATISTVVGNGLIWGGVLSMLVALVAHVRTVTSLSAKDIAAVNLAYAGRVIDGDEVLLGSEHAGCPPVGHPLIEDTRDRDVAALAVEPLRRTLHSILITDVLSTEDRTYLEDIDTKAGELAKRYRGRDLSLVGSRFAAELRKLQVHAADVVANYGR